MTWHVPINYVVRAADGGLTREQSLVWLYANMTSVTLPVTFNYGLQDYMKLNVNQSFYHRVLYPERMYVQFAGTLATVNTRMSVRDRTNLISDSFSLAYAGLLDWGLVLNLTQFASKERALTPLTELILQWDMLRQYFNEDDVGYLNSYVAYSMGDVYKEYRDGSSFTYVDHVQNLIQSRVLAAATRYNVGDSREFVTTQFTNFVDTDRTTRPWADIIGTVLQYGIRQRPTSFEAVFQ